MGNSRYLRMKKNLLSSYNLHISVLVVCLVFLSSTLAPTFVIADQFDEKIQKLREENEAKQNEIEDLEQEAYSLQDTIAALGRKIAAVESKISKNTNRYKKLLKDISAAEAELAKQKNLLGQNIKAMYLEGEISTIEMLASSNDLSDFLDKQQYREAVKDKIKSTLDRINILKQQLKKEKTEVERLLKEQKQLREQTRSQRAEQSRLLNLNAAEQAEFENEIANNKEKIEELRQQQILENIKLFGSGGVGIPGGGGYPWGNAYCVHTGQVGGACYNYDWYFNGSPRDTWGYGYRNCTSWVAYKLALAGKSGFSYLGNAAQWPSGAAARGISVSYGSGAQVGDAAVNPNGYYGHVMYVEAVSGNTVVVSDYNRMGDGLYRGPDGGSAGVVSQSGLVFIHF